MTSPADLNASVAEFNHHEQNKIICLSRIMKNTCLARGCTIPKFSVLFLILTLYLLAKLAE